LVDITFMKVLVIGTGIIGQEYASILSDLKVDFVNLCNSTESALRFKEKTGFDAIHGGLAQNKNILNDFSHFIVSSDIESSFSIATILFEQNCQNILLEKPGALSIDQFSDLYKLTLEINSNVYIGYNRRNYSSVLKLIELAKEDGGITSAHFDFTEWSHVIEKLDKSRELLNNWFFVNSTHVIDTAFHLIGKPEVMHSSAINNLEWHNPSIFVGSGISERSIPFSYHANWSSSGRWAIELKTRLRSLRLMPLESVFEQKIGSLEWEGIPIENSKDILFKPGFYQQVVEFLFVNKPNLKTVKEQFEDLSFYSKILGRVE